ncbi:restriction endonuclease subunit S [uncultured Brevundimonas sp.]|uniref:restriction endonuclease subunit S n=1 Tax=uncultured Brevundimonas sp. TaxID=213418 RepID=UPI0025FD311F|nr:restriction endonuclease subunit S [uncultured Brevundimonas sp.]
MPDHDFNYVGLEDIEAGTGRLFAPGTTPGRDIASAKTRFQAGDLLYGRLRPYLQKVIIAPSEGVAATELLVLRVHEGVDSHFLQEIFLGPDHQERVSQLMSGARMPRIRADQLLDLQIALPSLEIQRAIVRGLSVLRHRLTSLRARVAESLALAASFEQQILNAAFNGSLSASIRSDANVVPGKALLLAAAAARRARWEDERTVEGIDGKRARRSYPEAAAPEIKHLSASLPTTWALASLEQLTSATDSVCYGVVEPGEEVETGVPMVRIQDIDQDGIDLSGLRNIAPEVDERHARSRLKGGEVLVSLAGTIGRVARASENLSGANINRALAKVTPLDSDLGDWIALALRSPALQEWLTSSARGAARDILNLSTLVRAPVPLAPPQERLWLVEQLRHRLDRLTSLRAKLVVADVAFDGLWTNLRAKVLAGDASLSDPGDEAVAAARRARSLVPDGKRKITKGKAKPVATNRVKSGGPETRQDLRAILQSHADGLEPLRLLEEAGYGLQDVEAFFKNLAEAVAAGTILEHRSETDWPRLVVA